MEKKFLQYILYITLIEIRQLSHENNDQRTFWLCQMLHNIPLNMDTEEEIKETYKRLLENVEHLKIPEWLDARKKEFNIRFPEYQNV